jgi:tetratricopeptide (TPR) repeat protein
VSFNLRYIRLVKIYIYLTTILFISGTSLAYLSNGASNDITNTTLNITNTTLNITNTTLTIPNMSYNNINTILLTHLSNFLRDPLPNLRDVLFNIVEIIILCFLLGLIVLLFAWMSGLIGMGIAVLPFHSDKDSKYDGGAIADLLIANLDRINRIHHLPQALPQTGIWGEHLRTEEVQLPEESVTSSLTNVGSIGITGSTISIGQLLITLKRLWPIGNPGITISGSLQKFGSEKRLVAHMGSHETRSWSISRSDGVEDPIGGMITDLSFKIMKDLSPKCSARTWEGLKYYTEALHSYWRYTTTGNINDLEYARHNCIEAANAEKTYISLCNLFYQIGLACWNESKWERSSEMFLKAIDLKSDLEKLSPPPEMYRPYAEVIISEEEAKRFFAISYSRLFSKCFNGLGVSLMHLGNFGDANDAYETAINLAPENIAAHHNLANLHAKCERWEEAIHHHNKALTQKPGLIPSKIALAAIYWKTKDINLSGYCGEISKELLSKESEYLQACYYSNCSASDVERAVKLLKIAINRKQGSIKDVEDDFLFDRIRSDQRFEDFISSIRKSDKMANSPKDGSSDVIISED